MSKSPGLDTMEMFAVHVLTGLGDLPDPVIPAYQVLSPVKGADMLAWKVRVRASKSIPAHDELRVQIQEIGNGLSRIGAIGDGNCLVHSMFTATSPTYRAQNMEVRQQIADSFRNELVRRIDELRALADVIYAELGGASALIDAFDNLEADIRTEIDMELGPVIAQLYGFNYLAVRLDDELNMLPVVQSLTGRQPDLPTVFIHYMGGATDFGALGANYSGQGHYEVIVRPVLAAGSSKPRKGGMLPASGMVTLNELATTFMFSEEELAHVLAKFGNLNATANMSPRTKEIFIGSVARKRAEGHDLSPATLKTLAALEKRSTMKKSSNSNHGSLKNGSPKDGSPKDGSPKKTTSGRRRTTQKANTKAKAKAKTNRSNSNLSPNTLAEILAMTRVPNLD